VLAKFVRKINTIGENAHLMRVFPIHNLRNRVGKPTRVLRKVLVLALHSLLILSI
jgi:hypothetical protein